jgi:hypothetical protein
VTVFPRLMERKRIWSPSGDHTGASAALCPPGSSVSFPLARSSTATTSRPVVSCPSYRSYASFIESGDQETLPPDAMAGTASLLPSGTLISPICWSESTNAIRFPSGDHFGTDASAGASSADAYVPSTETIARLLPVSSSRTTTSRLPSGDHDGEYALRTTSVRSLPSGFIV